MEFWIDKQGDQHFHKKNWLVVKDNKYHYEVIEINQDKRIPLYACEIKVGGKKYMACPGCFQKDMPPEIRSS